MYQHATTSETFRQWFGLILASCVVALENHRMYVENPWQAGELLSSESRATGPLCIVLSWAFFFFCLQIITKKVCTLKFDVHNMNLFLVVAHLSHKEVSSSSHPGYFHYLSCLLWFLAIILSGKNLKDSGCPSAAAV